MAGRGMLSHSSAFLILFIMTKVERKARKNELERQRREKFQDKVLAMMVVMMMIMMMMMMMMIVIMMLMMMVNPLE